MNSNFQIAKSSINLSMKQENRLQKFTLPEPAFCIGGILQIDLLGRVQKQEMDGLYYIWYVPDEVSLHLFSVIVSIDSPVYTFHYLELLYYTILDERPPSKLHLCLKDF